MQKETEKPRLFHEQYEDLKRLLKPVNVKHFRTPDSMAEVEFDTNDITPFLMVVMRHLVNAKTQPVCYEEYSFVRKEYRYTVILNNICIWLIVEEAAVEKSNIDSGVSE